MQLIKKTENAAQDTLFDYRLLVVDVHSFFCSHGLTFDLWWLKFAVYNWTARHADRGLAANVEGQLQPRAIEALHCYPLVVKSLCMVIQSVLVEHFRPF